MKIFVGPPKSAFPMCRNEACDGSNRIVLHLPTTPKPKGPQKMMWIIVLEHDVPPPKLFSWTKYPRKVKEPTFKSDMALSVLGIQQVKWKKQEQDHDCFCRHKTCPWKLFCGPEQAFLVVYVPNFVPFSTSLHLVHKTDCTVISLFCLMLLHLKFKLNWERREGNRFHVSNVKQSVFNNVSPWYPKLLFHFESNIYSSFCLLPFFKLIDFVITRVFPTTEEL